ncbi:MAG: hypothetical protein IPK26_23235 [Planctomycetes bacterium]|nr:hypothetical protein [Planctomycetota bacterium]
MPQSRPQLGSTLGVRLNNLPTATAIVMTGFSNTVSPFGPLPVHLLCYGALGCYGRVSPDASFLLVGTGTTATFGCSTPARRSCSSCFRRSARGCRSAATATACIAMSRVAPCARR